MKGKYNQIVYELIAEGDKVTGRVFYDEDGPEDFKNRDFKIDVGISMKRSELKKELKDHQYLWSVCGRLGNIFTENGSLGKMFGRLELSVN
jgi:hypothetical protein